MDARFPYSPAEVAKVQLVQFGILSPDEIVIPLPPPPSPLRRWLSLLLCLGRVESGGEGVSDGTPVMGVC